MDVLGGQNPQRKLLVSEGMFFLATYSPSGTALNFLLCARPAVYMRMFWKALSQTSSWNVWKVAPQHLAVDSEREVGRPLKKSQSILGASLFEPDEEDKKKRKKRTSGQHFPLIWSLKEFSRQHIVHIKSPSAGLVMPLHYWPGLRLSRVLLGSVPSKVHF